MFSATPPAWSWRLVDARTVRGLERVDETLALYWVRATVNHRGTIDVTEGFNHRSMDREHHQFVRYAFDQLDYRSDLRNAGPASQFA